MRKFDSNYYHKIKLPESRISTFELKTSVCIGKPCSSVKVAVLNVINFVRQVLVLHNLKVAYIVVPDLMNGAKE